MIPGMPTRPLVRFRSALVAASVALLGLPSLAPAQSAGYNRRSANGRDYPSWERELDSSIPVPLPTARQGRHVLDLSIPLELPATGVVRLLRGGLVVPLVDGRVQVVDLEGKTLAEVEIGDGEPWAPLANRETALVAAGSTVVSVGLEGEVWRAALPAKAAWAPVLRPAGLAVTLEDGRRLLLDPETGRTLWTAEAEGSLSCGPAQCGGLLVWGTSDGRLVARQASDGSASWNEEVGDEIATINADESSVYFVGRGRTGRSKRAKGPFVGRAAVSAKGAEVKWRSRVGGSSSIEPFLLGPVVAFACHDGYLHAHERGDGRLAWRTDLPARLGASPRLVGGRLEVLLPLTGWAVSVAADNGAVMGWTQLEDEDETFVGPVALTNGYTVAATSFGRLVGLRWEYEGDAG